MTLNEIKLNILVNLSIVQQLEIIQFLTTRIADVYLLNNPVEDTDFDNSSISNEQVAKRYSLEDHLTDMEEYNDEVRDLLTDPRDDEDSWDGDDGINK